MTYKIGMVSLGCPKNQVDAEIMLSLLKEGGFEITDNEKDADVIIVNSCGFIEDAKKETIENLLELSELKKKGKLKALILTGCMAERYREETIEQIPEIDAVVGIGSNKEIVSIIKETLKGHHSCTFSNKSELIMNHDRILSTPEYMAYLRIADGCDNRCTYCAIPMIRGDFRSRPIEEVIQEAQKLAANGVKELILIAQDTTRYGEDLYGKMKLPELLEELVKIEKIHWIRILYTYPDRITDELLDTIAKENKILNYLDIPLQHCNGKVLQAMNRRGNRESLTKPSNKVRDYLPDAVIRTTFIAGFPGEDDDAFADLAGFIKDVRFNRMGCFVYSPEEGTPAALFEDQIDDEIKIRRQEILMMEQSVVNDEITEAKIGTEIEVLIEGYDQMNRCYYGRSIADAPEIDGKVFVLSSDKLETGEFYNIAITDRIDYDLIGKIAKQQRGTV